jgi:predicted dehydrogenase
MTRALRYGIVGAGMMAREHVRNLGLIPGSMVTAIADPDAGSRLSCAAEVEKVLGRAPAALDEAERLIERSDVDAVLIASPNDTHEAILRSIFSTRPRLPVLVEKPICTRASELQPLSAAAAAHGAPVWVAMEYRYMPPVAELVRGVAAGEVGRLRMLSIREHRFPFLPKVGDWNRFNERTGGTLVEKCCHFFDLMRLIAASEPVRVYASGAADVNHRDETYGGRVPDIVDNAYVIVDFANGVRAALDLCMFAEGAYFQEEIAATGDKARLEAFVPGVTRFWQGGGTEREAEIEFSPRSPQNPVRRKVHVDEAILKAGDHHGSTYFQHCRFRDAVLEGGRVEVTVSDGLKAVAIGIAGERSIAERRAVEIDGFNIK